MTPLVFDTMVNAAGFSRGMNQIEGIAGKTGQRLAGIFSGPMAALTGALSVGGIVALGKGFLDAGAEMETFEVRLGTLMGSTSEAKARMKDLYEFAAVTPFNTAQVVGAEVTLRGFGASAEAIMPGLIDLAAVMGMDLPQAAIDMGKAWNQGAAGMESDGAKVLRTMMQQRSSVDLTKMSIEDFREVLVDTLNTGAFAGGAARMATTFKGLVSNLEDSWAGFQRQVADAGLFENVKEALALTLDGINANTEASKEWAQIISDDIWFAVKGIAYTLAVAATGVDALRLGFNFMLAPLADAVILANDLAKRITDIDRMIAEKAGWDTIVAGLNTYRAGLDAVGERAAGVRDRAVETVLALADAKTPIQTMQELFAQIEASSKNTADNLTKPGAGTKPAGGGGDAGKAESKAWKDALEALERYMAAGEKLQAAEDDAAQNARDNAAQLAILRETDPRHRIELQALADIDAVRRANEEATAEQRRNLETMTAAAGTNMEDRLAAEADYHRAVVAMNQDAASQVALINEKKAQDIRAQNMSTVYQTMGAVQQVGDQVARALTMAYDGQTETINALQQQLIDGDEYYTDAQKNQIKARLDATKKAARRSFELAKIGSLASIGVNTAEGISKALASAAPPVNIVLAGITAAAGAAAFAQAASQQPAFHSGGLAPDEQLSRTLPGEAWLSRTGRQTMGDDVINKANAAVPTRPERIVVEQYYGHSLYDTAEAVRIRRGSPYVALVTASKSTPTGHRARV